MLFGRFWVCWYLMKSQNDARKRLQAEIPDSSTPFPAPVLRGNIPVKDSKSITECRNMIKESLPQIDSNTMNERVPWYWSVYRSRFSDCFQLQQLPLYITEYPISYQAVFAHCRSCVATPPAVGQDLIACFSACTGSACTW